MKKLFIALAIICSLFAGQASCMEENESRYDNPIWNAAFTLGALKEEIDRRINKVTPHAKEKILQLIQPDITYKNFATKLKKLDLLEKSELYRTIFRSISPNSYRYLEMKYGKKRKSLEEIITYKNRSLTKEETLLIDKYELTDRELNTSLKKAKLDPNKFNKVIAEKDLDLKKQQLSTLSDFGLLFYRTTLEEILQFYASYIRDLKKTNK